uniref:Phospholipid scramblase n=1 Tax=Leptobrachium leishanense TaxID=445787 RepID=A0A8C5ME76_9ANUR
MGFSFFLQSGGFVDCDPISWVRCGSLPRERPEGMYNKWGASVNTIAALVPNPGTPGQPPYVAYAGGHPVQYQPSGPGVPTSAWMPAPATIPNCPPGLEYLSQIDQLLVHQQVELLEAFTGFETNNKYEIKNSLGQRVYFAAEENDCCTRNCCGAARSFTMTIIDNTGREIIKLLRPYRCSSCCFPCCLQKLEVQAPPGATIGYVKQNWHPCLPKFTILNDREEEVLKISGPCMPCSCCTDVNFEALDGETSVGRISKQWTGLVKEYFTDADNFGVQFPMDLDVKLKAVVLGACFLIVMFQSCNNFFFVLHGL